VSAGQCGGLLCRLGWDTPPGAVTAGVYAVIGGDLVAVCGGGGDAARRAESARGARRIDDGERLYEPVMFDDRVVGVLQCPAAAAGADPAALAARLAPLLLGANRDGAIERNLRVLDWVISARDIAADVCDWTGVYYKASFVLGEEGTDLLLGPFLGAPTPHQRIPIGNGICGLALREERAVNVPDVRADPRYLACSAETRSELVVPLADGRGEFVAELDIDSRRAQGFPPALEERFRSFARTFAYCL
jgi:GAF domain-containing protein